MKIPFEWERLDLCTTRAKVIGGWIIRVENGIGMHGNSISESMVFIADQNHEWEIDSLKD